ncbi:MAG: selenium-dependent molybdenum cofactor biosynthesis protein YqeB [Atribacterota bacterium]
MKVKNGLIIIRGGGDLASGVAVRLFRAGFKIIILETIHPLAIRLPVSFASAVFQGICRIEDIEGILVETYDHADQIIDSRRIAVLTDPMGRSIEYYNPPVLVDAIMAKRNLGTSKEQAPLVIGLGPGFQAGVDVDVVIETKRGHYLGRAIYRESAIPDTGIPGEIEGESEKRLLRAPAKGRIIPEHEIGDLVQVDEIIATVNGIPLRAQLSGVLRGLIYPNSQVTEGMKVGDIDPRGIREYCFTVSDKALSVGGGVLEAVCNYFNKSGRGSRKKEEK